MFNLTEQGEWLYSRAERPAEKPVENLPGVCYNKSVKTKLKGLRQRCGLRKDETLTKKPKFTLQLQYNSPVILTFFLLSLGVLFLGQWTGGWTTTHLFCVYRSSLKDPLFYVRLFGHVLGHGSWDHFLNNMLLLLVIGPPMEEKYGSIPLLRGILLTALISGILQCALSPTRPCWGRRASCSCSSCWRPCPVSRVAFRSRCCWWRCSTWASRCMMSSLCGTTSPTSCTSWAACAVRCSATPMPRSPGGKKSRRK